MTDWAKKVTQRGKPWLVMAHLLFGDQGAITQAQTWSSFQLAGNSDVGEGSYYNYQPENYLYTPQERTNIFITGNYELIDGVNGFMELSYINRKSDQLLAPTPLFIISEGITKRLARHKTHLVVTSLTSDVEWSKQVTETSSRTLTPTGL